jgi:predicted Zn-dependent peptidase
VSDTIPGVRSVALGIWIGVGSRHEEPRDAGLSHFLEHMLFKGTPTRSPAEIASQFDALGGEVNAATGRDYTVLYTRVVDDLVDRASAIVADMVGNPAFLDLEQERDVVLEEIAMYEDDPQDLVHDLAAQAAFPDQPLGQPVIGTAAVIEGVDRDSVGSHHRAHYTLDNVVLAAAGSISHDDAVALAARMLDGLPPARTAGRPESARPGAPRALVREKPTEQVHLVLTGPGLARDDRRRHANAVLDTILGGSMSSRLFQEVRERRGLAYSVGSFAIGYAETGQVGVYTGTREDNLPLVCEVLGAELRRIADEPVPAEELARAKDHLKGRLVLSLESSGARMNRIGRSHLFGGELLSVDELTARIEAVTAADVQELAREHWRPEHLSAAAIGPNADPIHSALRTVSETLA